MKYLDYIYNTNYIILTINTPTSYEMIPLNEADFNKKYNWIKKLGEGGSSTVYLVKNITDGKYFAAKVVKDIKYKRRTWCNIRTQMIPDEIYLSEQLSHPSIAQLRDIHFEQGNWILVTDYFPHHIDLFEYVKRKGPMGTKDTKGVIMKLSNVLNYLISEKIDHRDIKDENILYNPLSKEIKLIDFGSASYITNYPYKEMQGTDLYIPPEFYKTGKYSALPGITWAVGCLAHTLLNDRNPFESINDIINQKHPKYRSYIDDNTKKFLMDLTTTDENQRIHPEKITDHPWMKP